MHGYAHLIFALQMGQECFKEPCLSLSCSGAQIRDSYFSSSVILRLWDFNPL